MSIWGNDAKKNYLDLNTATSQKPQVYCLKKLTEFVTSLLDEVEVCNRLAKKIKRFSTSQSSLIQV